MRLFGEPEIGLWRDHARYGYAHIPNATGRHRTPEFDARYTIDSAGNRRTPTPARPLGSIVTLGCSFTFGHGVADDEAYPSVLARLLPRYRVANRAVMGWGTGQALLALEEELLGRPAPRLVLLGWISAQAGRNLLRLSWLERLSQFHRKNVRFDLVDGRPVYRGTVGPEAGSDDSPEMLHRELEMTLAMIVAMKRLCDRGGTRFIVIMLPDPRPNVHVNDWLARTLERRGIAMLDARAESRDYYPRDGHPRAGWHRAVARAVARHPLFREALSGAPPR